MLTSTRLVSSFFLPQAFLVFTITIFNIVVTSLIHSLFSTYIICLVTWKIFSRKSPLYKKVFKLILKNNYKIEVSICKHLHCLILTCQNFSNTVKKLLKYIQNVLSCITFHANVKKIKITLY